MSALLPFRQNRFCVLQFARQTVVELKNHLGDHKTIQKTWVGELIRGLIAVAVILGTAGIIYAVGWK